MLGCLYVAGPMRGRWHLNFPAFDAAENMLNALGWDTVNPASKDRMLGVDPADPDTYVKAGKWSDCMKRDFSLILNWCDGIALLPGWHLSPGARAERKLAETVGLEVFHIDPRDGYFEREVVVGISGYARSGKDTVAQEFVKHHGYERIALADALKTFLYHLNPVAMTSPRWRVAEVVERVGWEDAKKVLEIRGLLQRLGTDAGRTVLGDEIWIDTLFFSDHGARIVVPDVRFPNEADAIKSRGGFMVRVNRPGVGPVNGHQSETALEDYAFDYVIENDREIEDLAGPVDRIVERISDL